MFKKTLLVALVAATAATTASAATVYDKDGNSFEVGGRVQGGFYSVAANDGDASALKGAARLNIGGQSVITEGVKAVAFAEWDVASSTSTDGTFETRYATVGFDTDNYGSLVVGQTDTAIYNVIAKTDVFEDFGSEANTYWTLGGRQEGQAVYQYRNGGFSFGASYQSAFDVNTTRVNNGVALALGYGFDVAENLPLDFQVGYDNYDLRGKDNNVDSYAASVSLGNLGDGFYSAFLYQFSEVDAKASSNGYEFVVGYGFDKVSLLAGYEYLDTAADDSNADVNKMVLHAGYQFTDNFSAYTEAEFGFTGENAPDSRNDKYTANIRYDF